MVENRYKNEEDLMEIDFADLNHAGKAGDRRYEKRPIDLRRKRRLLLGGAGILIIVVIITLSFRGGNRFSEEFTTSIQNQVEQLEARMTRLEGMRNASSDVQEQERTLRHSISILDGSINELRGKLNNVAQELVRLEKKMSVIVAEGKSRGAAVRKRVSDAHPRYHVVRRGDSLYGIAAEYGISVKKLCHLNRISSKEVIRPGQKLLIRPGA